MELVLTTKSELKALINESLKDFEESKKVNIVEDQLLDKKEAAKLLGVSLATIDNYRRNGIIPSYRIGSAVRFKKSEIIESITG